MLDYGFNFMKTKIYIDNESTICIVKNLVFHSKTKNIEIRHHYISDSYEKKLIQVIKIHTDQNIADLLTKAFDASRTQRYLSLVVPLKKVGDEAVHKELGDRIERAATTASSFEVEQDSGSGPRCQDTILVDVNAQTRHQLVLPVQVLAAEAIQLSTHLCIQQFWATTNVNMVNGVRQLQALIDKKKMIIKESCIRSDLHLEDAEGNDFSGRITRLFDTIMVQPSEEVGEDSNHPTDSNQIHIVDQPSTSSPPKKKKKSMRKQKKEAEVAKHEESVPTPSNDLPASGEDSMQLPDLMVLCTQLQKQVLDIEKAKSDQAIEIASLKKRVDKLENRRKFKTTRLKRLKKVGVARRIESSNNRLGAQDEDLMFDIGVLDGDAMFVDATIREKDEHSTKIDDSTTGEAVTTAGVEDSAAPTIPTTVKETFAQTLMEIKAAKPKAKGIVFHDLEKQVS
ncbi:hypothetical protein Tco_0904522, partial [Tanacetum coccineum]